MNYKEIAEQIFLSGVRSVLPSSLIPSQISVNNNILSIGELRFPLDAIDNIYVTGAGKASAQMAAELEKILGNRIKEGQIIVKYGHSCKLKYIRVTEAGHPVPDSNGFHATGKILKIASNAGSNDLVLCLLSGGGSSLLADFPEGSSAEEIIDLNDLLINSGACIKEINAVRKHISYVKGGQLSRAAYPATLISLILSDVPGDQTDVIASGPTAPDPTTFNDAMDVLEKFNLVSRVPRNILNFLREGIEGKKPETPKQSDSIFEKTSNVIIGTNRKALESARLKALEYNFNALIIDDQLQGDTTSVAEYIVDTALNFQNDKNEVKPLCLLFGGETTINMTGKGKGGRNQHLALQVAGFLQQSQGITVLCAGTDGNDGPTEAAGAVVNSTSYSEALFKEIDPQAYMSDFDSWHFFKKAGGHVITGPTMTNVMDIIVVIIEGAGC